MLKIILHIHLRGTYLNMKIKCLIQVLLLSDQHFGLSDINSSEDLQSYVLSKWLSTIRDIGEFFNSFRHDFSTSFNEKCNF